MANFLGKCELVEVTCRKVVAGLELKIDQCFVVPRKATDAYIRKEFRKRWPEFEIVDIDRSCNPGNDVYLMI